MKNFPQCNSIPSTDGGNRCAWNWPMYFPPGKWQNLPTLDWSQPACIKCWRGHSLTDSKVWFGTASSNTFERSLTIENLCVLEHIGKCSKRGWGWGATDLAWLLDRRTLSQTLSVNPLAPCSLLWFESDCSQPTSKTNKLKPYIHCSIWKMYVRCDLCNETENKLLP